MMFDNESYREAQNLTTITIIDSQNTVTSIYDNDNNDMKRILSYAIPLSCAVIIIVLLVAATIHHSRRRLMEKWTSLKRMKNTNPRYTERAGLRRDSEDDLHNGSIFSIRILNDPEQWQSKPELSLQSVA